jgi:mono/diheme cytochrome c family protein
MRPNRWISSVTLIFLIGCSSDGSDDPVATGGNAGTSGQGGSSGAGGTKAVTGGATATGGVTSSGGQSTTGGQTATGGSSTGGQISGGTGGATSGGRMGGNAGKFGGGSGGTAAGGGGMTGGSPSGGSPQGGASGGASGGMAGGSGGTDPQTFYVAICSMCHGDKGQGVSMKGPEIQHPVRDFATWVVRNGRSGHPGYPDSKMDAYPAAALPDATLNAIFDSLSTPALPKPTTGKALYEDYCANCHGATGTGGTANHDAKGEPLSKALQMVRGGHSLMQFSSRTGYMPKWSTTELSDAEVESIVGYLDSL